MEIPRILKVTTACTSCKSRKVKCSGQQPCNQCVANNLDCCIDPDADFRRTGVLKRKLADLEDDYDLLQRLLRTLHHRNSYVEELVEFIRDRHPSLGEIKSFMDGTITRDGMEKTPELLDVYDEIDRLNRLPARDSRHDWALDISRLCDTPLFSVPARPWTKITEDDNFVSHLVSLWFTWHYSLFDWIDQELFVRDMKSGNLGSHFCSPFLVNAMLAEACFYSDYPETCAVPGDLSTRGEHFYNEAKRLLEDEEENISIATVYGFGVLYSSTSLIGKDRLGWVYLVRASNALRMFQSRQKEILANVDLPKERLNQAIARLELGLFGVVTMTSNVFLKPPQLDKPTARLPVHQEDSTDTWFPYPLQISPLPIHKNCVVNERTRLGIIVWDITHYIAEEEKPPRSDMESAVMGWHRRLLDWASKLPSCIAVTDKSIPTVLDLHMYYHTMILTIYAYLKSAPSGADEATIKSAAKAREICITSAHALSNLVSIHETHWGLSRMTAANMHFLSVGLQMLVDDLEDEKNKEAFLTLCRASIPLTQRCLTLKGMFRMVEISTFQTKRPVPPEIVAVFKDFERRLWKPEDRKQYSSLYPHFATAIRMKEAEGGFDEVEMDRVLEAWDDLTVSDVMKGNGGMRAEAEDFKTASLDS